MQVSPAKSPNRQFLRFVKDSRFREEFSRVRNDYKIFSEPYHLGRIDFLKSFSPPEISYPPPINNGLVGFGIGPA
jgi:hypothetical protein